MKLIAKTFAGLEEILAGELTQLGAEQITIGNRMVTFKGDKELMYKANFCLRTAVRILKPIATFHARNADDIYEAVKRLPWEKYMDNDWTFIVDDVVFSTEFRHSKFAAYRVKDAICDYFTEQTGKRPNIRMTNPDLRINLHISECDVTISLDSSGESLHHRGYKTHNVAAPLNEVLAAGIVMLSGWNADTDFIDPMCGSGTIAIEAALIAKNIYPGLFRKEFAFEHWKDFDSTLLEDIYNDDSAEKEFKHHIYGYDINHYAVDIAQENVKNASVNDIVTIKQRDVRDFQSPKQPSIIITNPPYGERITSENILSLYKDIGTVLKQRFVGGDAWILSYHEECFAQIGFRPSTRIALYNGPLACELRKYQVFEGKLSDRRREGLDIKTAQEREQNKHFKANKELKSREKKEFNNTKLSRNNYKWGDRRRKEEV